MPPAATVDQSYISVGANRSSSCSASTSSGLLAYGAGHLVALWNADVRRIALKKVKHGLTRQPSSSKGVHATLPGHTGVVTTVKLLQDEDAEGKGAAFISGDAAGNVRAWKHDHGQVGMSLLYCRSVVEADQLRWSARLALTPIHNRQYQL